MTKIVLDANQFVSGFIIAKSTPAKVIDLVEQGKVLLLISQPILEEVKRVLLYPHIKKIHGCAPKEVGEKLKRVTKFAEFIQSSVKIEAIKDDPTDNKYLECAVAGGADFIISGDRHLKDLKDFQGIKIISPSTFLKIISKL